MQIDNLSKVDVKLYCKKCGNELDFYFDDDFPNDIIVSPCQCCMPDDYDVSRVFLDD